MQQRAQVMLAPCVPAALLDKAALAASTPKPASAPTSTSTCTRMEPPAKENLHALLHDGERERGGVVQLRQSRCAWLMAVVHWQPLRAQPVPALIDQGAGK